jgi:hypothetical protein
MATFIRRRLSMGWLPDYPDFRDLTIEHVDVSAQNIQNNPKYNERERRYRPLQTIKKNNSSCLIPES